MDEVWTVKRTLDWCGEYLERHGDAHARQSAEWLMSHATGLSRVELYAFFDRPLRQAERDVLREGLRRRGTGEPLQYITGEVGFRHIVVRTTHDVLIPRPETEVLVSEVLSWLDGQGLVVRHGAEITAPDEGDADPGDGPGADGTREPAESSAAHVLEVGTGTGCIACSLAREAGASVTATDISDAAVACARDNADRLGLSGLVSVERADCATGVEGHFDVLVSNPPYIPTAELASLPAEVVEHEPRLALDGGADGLAFFDRLVAEAPRLLRAGGLLACELHETCLDDAARRLGAVGFADVRVVADLVGRPRVVLGVRAASRAV